MDADKTEVPFTLIELRLKVAEFHETRPKDSPTIQELGGIRPKNTRLQTKSKDVASLLLFGIEFLYFYARYQRG